MIGAFTSETVDILAVGILVVGMMVVVDSEKAMPVFSCSERMRQRYR